MPNYARIFAKYTINPIVFRNVTTRPDTSGDSGVSGPSDGTMLMGSVQQSAENRVVIHAGEETLVTHTLYFAAPPVDTSVGSRAGGTCRAMDLFVWAGRTFYALGPARDEGGRGAAWSVDCQERA